jgi:hypothetical protein
VLRTDRVHGSIPGMGNRFVSSPKRQDRLWSASSLLFCGYRGSFPGVKWPGSGATHSHVIPELRRSGAFPLLSPRPFTALTGTLPFFTFGYSFYYHVSSDIYAGGGGERSSPLFSKYEPLARQTYVLTFSKHVCTR